MKIVENFYLILSCMIFLLFVGADAMQGQGKEVAKVSSKKHEDPINLAAPSKMPPLRNANFAIHNPPPGFALKHIQKEEEMPENIGEVPIPLKIDESQKGKETDKREENELKFGQKPQTLEEFLNQKHKKINKIQLVSSKILDKLHNKEEGKKLEGNEKEMQGKETNTLEDIEADYGHKFGKEIGTISKMTGKMGVKAAQNPEEIESEYGHKFGRQIGQISERAEEIGGQVTKGNVHESSHNFGSGHNDEQKIGQKEIIVGADQMSGKKPLTLEGLESQYGHKFDQQSGQNIEKFDKGENNEKNANEMQKKDFESYEDKSFLDAQNVVKSKIVHEDQRKKGILPRPLPEWVQAKMQNNEDKGLGENSAGEMQKKKEEEAEDDWESLLIDENLDQQISQNFGDLKAKSEAKNHRDLALKTGKNEKGLLGKYEGQFSWEEQKADSEISQNLRKIAGKERIEEQKDDSARKSLNFAGVLGKLITKTEMENQEKFGKKEAVEKDGNQNTKESPKSEGTSLFTKKYNDKLFGNKAGSQINRKDTSKAHSTKNEKISYHGALTGKEKEKGILESPKLLEPFKGTSFRGALIGYEREKELERQNEQKRIVAALDIAGQVKDHKLDQEIDQKNQIVEKKQKIASGNAPIRKEPATSYLAAVTGKNEEAKEKTIMVEEKEAEVENSLKSGSDQIHGNKIEHGKKFENVVGHIAEGEEEKAAFSTGQTAAKGERAISISEKNLPQNQPISSYLAAVAGPDYEKELKERMEQKRVENLEEENRAKKKEKDSVKNADQPQNEKLSDQSISQIDQMGQIVETKKKIPIGILASENVPITSYRAAVAGTNYEKNLEESMAQKRAEAAKERGKIRGQKFERSYSEIVRNNQQRDSESPLGQIEPSYQRIIIDKEKQRELAEKMAQKRAEYAKAINHFDGQRFGENLGGIDQSNFINAGDQLHRGQTLISEERWKELEAMAELEGKDDSSKSDGQFGQLNNEERWKELELEAEKQWKDDRPKKEDQFGQFDGFNHSTNIDGAFRAFQADNEKQTQWQLSKQTHQKDGHQTDWRFNSNMAIDLSQNLPFQGVGGLGTFIQDPKIYWKNDDEWFRNRSIGINPGKKHIQQKMPNQAISVRDNVSSSKTMPMPTKGAYDKKRQSHLTALVNSQKADNRPSNQPVFPQDIPETNEQIRAQLLELKGKREERRKKGKLLISRSENLIPRAVQIKSNELRMVPIYKAPNLPNEPQPKASNSAERNPTRNNFMTSKKAQPNSHLLLRAPMLELEGRQTGGPVIREELANLLKQHSRDWNPSAHSSSSTHRSGQILSSQTSNPSHSGIVKSTLNPDAQDFVPSFLKKDFSTKTMPPEKNFPKNATELEMEKMTKFNENKSSNVEQDLGKMGQNLETIKEKPKLSRWIRKKLSELDANQQLPKKMENLAEKNKKRKLAELMSDFEENSQQNPKQNWIYQNMAQNFAQNTKKIEGKNDIEKKEEIRKNVDENEVDGEEIVFKPTIKEKHEEIKQLDQHQKKI